MSRTSDKEIDIIQILNMMRLLNSRQETFWYGRGEVTVEESGIFIDDDDTSFHPTHGVVLYAKKKIANDVRCMLLDETYRSRVPTLGPLLCKFYGIDAKLIY